MGTSNELSNFFKYAPLVTNEAMISAQRAEYARQHKLNIPRMADNACYLGIEVEIENVRNPPQILGWVTTEDGSLRNQGFEFVSRPIRGQNVYYLLHKLFGELKERGASFSERCSIHVHMNVRRLSVDQLVTLLMTYMVVEQTLYRFVQRSGYKRDRNIFCVPLQEGQHSLGLPYFLYQMKSGKVGDAVHVVQRYWKKYSGLNILPVSTLGTIEFRHLGGTYDLPMIMEWLNILQHLRMFAFNMNTEEVKQMIFALNTNSEYYVFLQRVFGKYVDILFDRRMKFTELEEGVSAVKQAFALRESLSTSVDNFPSSSLGEYIKNYSKQEIKTISVKDVEELVNKLEKEYEATYTRIRELDRQNKERPLAPEELRENKTLRHRYYELDTQISSNRLKLTRLLGEFPKKKQNDSLLSIYGARR